MTKLEKLTIDDIEPNSARGQAYEKAKANPYSWQMWQDDGEFRQVRYTPPIAGILFEDEEVGRTPGHWYEKPFKDLTTMSEQSSVGFRVYEKQEEEV